MSSKFPWNLKLAYIIGTYPEITTTFIDREMQTLSEKGFQIQIVSIRRPDSSVTQIEEYAQIQKQVFYLLPANWARLFFAHLVFILLRPRPFFNTLWFLLTKPYPRFQLRLKTLLHFGEGVYAAYYLRTKKWDHIHAHFIDRAATVAMIASRLLDTPYSVTAHADDIYNEPVLAYEKLSNARFSITVSGYNKTHLLKQYPRLDPKRMYVLHPWVDLRSFKPPAIRSNGNRFRILTVGRLVENKGHQYLIEACRDLQKAGMDFDCHIIGQGPLGSELKVLIRQWNLEERVHMLGSQPQAEVKRYLSQADVFVLACNVAKNGDRDGMPVAIAEAMAMEVPVISTDILGISEMVQPGTGFLVPQKDSKNLANAIQKIYQADPNSRSMMGRYGRAVICEHFDLNTGIQKLASLFQLSMVENDLEG